MHLLDSKSSGGLGSASRAAEVSHGETMQGEVNKHLGHSVCPEQVGKEGKRERHSLQWGSGHTDVRDQE